MKTLQPTSGGLLWGGADRPFMPHHNFLGQDAEMQLGWRDQRKIPRFRKKLENPSS